MSLAPFHVKPDVDWPSYNYNGDVGTRSIVLLAVVAGWWRRVPHDLWRGGAYFIIPFRYRTISGEHFYLRYLCIAGEPIVRPRGTVWG